MASMAVFHSMIAGDRRNFAEKLITKALEAPFGDFRHWQAITTWVTSIGDELVQDRHSCS